MTDFRRTAKAAAGEVRSRWSLIEAIADDAVEAKLPITGAKSVDSAVAALSESGCDYALSTVSRLCLVAKFDHESSASQRKVWRRYGWTCLLLIAGAGWTQEAAADFLSTRRTQKEIAEAIRRTSTTSECSNSSSIDDRWAAWVQKLNSLMVAGGKLADESETDELNGTSELAVAIYRRVVERQLDAEIRQLLETVDG